MHCYGGMTGCLAFFSSLGAWLDDGKCRYAQLEYDDQGSTCQIALLPLGQVTMRKVSSSPGRITSSKAEVKIHAEELNHGMNKNI